MQNLFLIPLLGAIQGSFLLSIASYGLDHVKSSPPSIDQVLWISVAAGTSLLAAAWMMYRATGGLFNPAVSFALYLIGGISLRRFAFFFIAQVWLILLLRLSINVSRSV